LRSAATPLVILNGLVGIVSRHGADVERAMPNAAPYPDPALFWKVKSRDSVSTALRGRKQLACLAIRFPVAVKARLLGIVSAEFVAEELAVCGAPRLQFAVHDC
jgi:hypothetical protein